MTPLDRSTACTVAAARSAARARRAAVTLVVAAGMLSVLSGCVTERIEPSGRLSPYVAPGVDPSRPRSAFPQTPRASASDAPINAVAVGFVTKPMGDFVTDGLSLPLISPDGRHLALRIGTPPSDELRLAPAPREGEAVPRIVTVEASDPSRIEIYRLQANQQPTLILPMIEANSGSEAQNSEPIPHGVLLGRSCTNEGFLIEWPRADGSRWIGFVRWTTGRVNWLVRSDEDVPWLAASNAVLTSSGDLVFAYRTDPAQGWALARRSSAGVFDELDSTHAPIRWPVLSFSGALVAQCVVRDGRVRIERVDSGARALDLGPAQHTLELYNATISHQPAGQRLQAASTELRIGENEGSAGAANTLISEWGEGFVVVEAGQTAVSMWNSRLSRVLRAPTGVSAVHVYERGLFFTSNTGLSFVPNVLVENRWVPTPARVVTPLAGLIRSSGGGERGDNAWEGVVIHPIKGFEGQIRVLNVKMGDMQTSR